MPTFSVIIPTFNRERFVTEDVQSVLRQACKDFEIIVIDDGSTDNTREALEPYKNAIRYLHQATAGSAPPGMPESNRPPEIGFRSSIPTISGWKNIS